MTSDFRIGIFLSTPMNVYDQIVYRNGKNFQQRHYLFVSFGNLSPEKKDENLHEFP